MRTLKISRDEIDSLIKKTYNIDKLKYQKHYPIDGDVSADDFEWVEGEVE